MFSLFHKEASTVASPKPDAQTKAQQERSESASSAGASCQQRSTVAGPGEEVHHQQDAGASGAHPVTATPAAGLGQMSDRQAGTLGSDASLAMPISADGCTAEGAADGLAVACGERPTAEPWAEQARPPVRRASSQRMAEPLGEAESEEDVPVEVAGLSDEVGSPVPCGPRRPPKGKQLRSPEDARRQAFTPQQRLLLLDTWRRSGLPGKDFAALVGLSKHTLYKWSQLFEKQGPAGLMDQPRGAREGSRLPEVTRRTILMLKEQHPEWGCQRISDLLLRGPALPASASAVARVLHEAGYQLADEPSHRHPEPVRRFERAKPNQLWQTDLFTFMLKRQNRRVYLVAFLDDHSRFLVSYGLHASAATALVLEALEAGLASYGPPEEILTDNGPQYVTWRGKSQFTRRLEKHGIRQIVARPRRPQTLGKIERFWGTLWREFLEGAVFLDLAEARTRIGHFLDYYNFQRPHQGADGLVPADRFFQAAPTVLAMLKERVAANALELARGSQTRAPFYVTGQVAGQAFSVHAEGERLVLTREGQSREEIELTSGRSPRGEETTMPGESTSSGVATAEPLPRPVCPDGSPAPGVEEPACDPPPPPGQTRLDVSWRRGEEHAADDPMMPNDEPEQGGNL